MRPILYLLCSVLGLVAWPLSSQAARTDASRSLFPPARPATVQSVSADARKEHLDQATATRWSVDWDPWTQAATWGRGGRPERGETRTAAEITGQAAAFVREHAALLGVEAPGTAADHTLRSAHGWNVVWQQRVGGQRVVGAILNLALRDDGEVVAFRSRFVPPQERDGDPPTPDNALQTSVRWLGQPLRLESSEQVWVVLPQTSSYRLQAAQEVVVANAHGGRWKVQVTSVGIVEVENLLRFEQLQGAATGDIKPLYAEDADVSRPFAWLRVGLDDPRSTTTHSDALGNWSVTLAAGNYMLHAPLEGLFASVTNDAGDPPALFESNVAIPGNLPVHFGSAQARDDERTLYYHTNVIHDWVAQEFGFTLMDFPVPVTAAVHNPNNGSPNYANAFWNGSGMAFGNGGGSFANFGLFADVIYHEYTHGITDYMYRPAGGLPGALGGAIHEGLSDYFACTLTDESLIGENLAELGGAFRNLDNGLLWPDDRDPADEVHRNGEIFAGALWDVRMLLGRQIADPIIHFARTLHPVDFEEYLDAILVQDDLIFGDGAGANGTPHDDAILQAFALHGMGPLASRIVAIQHHALGDTEEADVPRTVHARIGTVLPGVIDQMWLHWTNGTQSAQLQMQPGAAGDWEAVLPAQAEGAQVDYWLQAIKLRPHQETRLPVDAPAQTFTYHVGPDTDPPHIQHVAPATLPEFAWPATLGMRIEDNLGLATCWVEFQRNGGPVSRIGLVPLADDPAQFRTTFPNVGGQVGDVFTYWILAQDASQSAHVSRLPATGAFTFTMVETLEDGFEQEGGVWLHRPAVPGRDDPWRVAAGTNHTPGGQRAWSCGNEDGTYPIVTAAELTTDWYLLGDGAQASIWSRIDAEPNGPTGAFDGGIIQILVEGDVSPALLTPLSGYPRTMGETADTNLLPPGTPCLSGTDSDWQLLQFDLSAWAGQRVQLHFVFGSDNVASSHSGWLLDDFVLSPGVRNPTDAPETVGPRTRLLAGPPAPNPFNPQVAFDLDVGAGSGHVVLDILDARGRQVHRLFVGTLPPGPARFVWTGRDAQGRRVASGVYWYRLRSAAGTETGSLVLVR